MTLTAQQRQFIALHLEPGNYVARWKWTGIMLRAHSDAGDVVAIAVDAFTELVKRGLVELVGIAGARITMKGRKTCVG